MSASRELESIRTAADASSGRDDSSPTGSEEPSARSIFGNGPCSGNGPFDEPRVTEMSRAPAGRAPARDTAWCEVPAHHWKIRHSNKELLHGKDLPTPISDVEFFPLAWLSSVARDLIVLMLGLACLFSSREVRVMREEL